LTAAAELVAHGGDRFIAGLSSCCETKRANREAAIAGIATALSMPPDGPPALTGVPAA
jgi:hypothetical protein